jgi:hypothetical protein
MATGGNHGVGKTFINPFYPARWNQCDDTLLGGEH